MASNTAAWLTAAKATPLTVGPAPLWVPKEDEILVKNHAVAINPVDGTIQAHAWWPIDYPAILGHDVAGEVAEVGPNVTRFKKGDRVMGNAIGMVTKQHRDNGFQSYTILQTKLASALPDNIAMENAVVIPLGCSTAAAGLFQHEFLDLQFPTEPRQRDTGKTILIWGGASSVGSNAIQLAVAAGYDVVTTASSKNFQYVKQLGATEAFDYKGPDVQNDLLEYLRNKAVSGILDCIGGSATVACLEIASAYGGTKFVATTKPNFPAPPEGVKIKHIFATTIKDNHVGKAIYEDFLPKALKAGSFVPAPEPLVVGRGLESVQKGMDMINAGVSARKLVVLL